MIDNAKVTKEIERYKKKTPKVRKGKGHVTRDQLTLPPMIGAWEVKLESLTDRHGTTDRLGHLEVSLQTK